MYASDSCNYCKAVKEKLKDEDIDFKVKLTKDFEDDWNQVVNTTGIGLLPTIFYKDNFFLPGRNFTNPDHLVQIIKNYKKIKFSDSKIILERIHTLNYNISMAFNKMDNILKQIETKINTDEHESTD